MNSDPSMDAYGSQEVFYSDFYKSVIFGKGLGPWAVRRSHSKMEKTLSDFKFSKTLELGAGNGEHLDFIEHNFDEYFVTDLKPPRLNKKWKADQRVQCHVVDAENIPYAAATFDRVVVTCLLHHVSNPEKVLLEILRVLKNEGVATLFLSCDPGLLVRMLRAITTARAADKNGFKGYGLMVARDHRNHIGSLLQMVRFVFRSCEINIRFYPFRIHSWNLNGYVVVQISKSN
jgi:SAM-dependent methyltransferase